MTPSVFASTVSVGTAPSAMALRPSSHYTFGLNLAADTADDKEAGVDDDDDRTMVALVQDTAAHTLSLAAVPLPVLGSPDEHLVQVHAVAIAREEFAWPGHPGPTTSAVPGYEFSGTVVLAPAHSPFQPGAEVYACTSVLRPGSACEYTLARTHEMCQKPENLSWEEAATVPRSALAAWQALFVLGDIQPLSLPRRPPPFASDTGAGAVVRANASKRVLVTEAASGVGLWVVQLARLAGVGYVAGTCGPANLDFVRSLGAHQAAEAPADGAYDLVVHCGEGVSDADDADGVFQRCGGAVVCMASGTKTTVLLARGDGRAENAPVAVQADSVQLQAVTDLLEAGAAKAAFDSAFAPEQYEAALARVQDRHLRGKVVLRLD